MSIKSWFLSKNFNQNEQYIIKTAIMGGELSIERETEKAILFKANSDWGTLTFWCPKSCLVDSSEIEELAPASMKGLEYNAMLVEYGKQHKIKGIRKGLKTNTLIKKIQESGLPVPGR